ncbi:hypothetical protein A3E66_04920 [Candidatus Daviesbacteria bacterium RIFCSPHIGHO2_12_FULL_37_16]|uniref:Uncharacterized protein n=3 Tax=Candidatus Daviesiibacteriota TaxID=1752718 RepID=A0A1F5K094_9BACT|nr:MAG: hypothetical protein US28_C0043G0005 [Candidatus Daviesbacteria bacterium GW2011_GWA1_36_8]OGE34332.1 MAG: hypothetical protein A3E66_04920 [Candidatus Daviesbacteria bacterium RIFCSPHIGHO2_12_FULL_37_16]
MPRVISFIFFLLIVVISQIKPAFASHLPVCTDTTKGSFINDAHEVDDSNIGLRACPPETFCYEEIAGAPSPNILCYAQKEVSAPTPDSDSKESTDLKPQPTPLPPYPRANKEGVTCSLSPSIISINGTTVFNASGLDKNTLYRLVINTQERTTPELVRINSGAQGKIRTALNPKAINLALESGYVLLSKVRFGGTDFVCSAQILISEKLEDLPKDQKFYRCPAKGQACVEATDYTGAPNMVAANPDQAECDKACMSSGDSFEVSGNQLLTAQTCDLNAAAGSPNACSKAMGQPCGDIEGQAISEGRGLANIKEGRISTGKPTGIMTAIGCIPTEPKALVEGIVRFVSLASGGIALLIMIFGAFRMITAVGNPDSIKAGRDQFISAIYGLLFIIFSVLLLQFIGVDILGIPGFTR